MIKALLQNKLSQVISGLYTLDFAPSALLVVPTKKEFQGDFTLNVFPIAGKIKLPPHQVASAIGEVLVSEHTISSFELVQGFLNMKLKDEVYIQSLQTIVETTGFGHGSTKHKTVLVEFSSPNTNKPLHLGHIRNMLLGSSMARILEVSGYTVKRIQVINDRGIAICKSMLAWKKWGAGSTPESTGIKGDHFVGHYYVLFEKEFSAEFLAWQTTPPAREEYLKRKEAALTESQFFKEYKNTYFNQYSLLGIEAREMLLMWEQKDPGTLDLWSRMNQWVYDGFKRTYERMGIVFDDTDYESITYLLGKEAVSRGIEKGIFTARADHSVWIDLTDVGMDQKLVLRSDGTSVYITQDLGTAQKRYEKYHMDKLIYVVADEQDYHFKVLFEILKRFNEPYASGLHHLSYGMVELPEGKMKSREGTVVDADDLLDEIIQEATSTAKERGDLEELDLAGQKQIIDAIALGAIKFFMLKVQAKKRMVFNPKDSLDLQGQTGPYIQNAYVRIQSVLRKSITKSYPIYSTHTNLFEEEKELIQLLEGYPQAVTKAAEAYDPSELANYSYVLAKAYHRFYHEVPILRSEDPAALQFRLVLSEQVARVLHDSFNLLGITMPERM
ncbi:MAG: arginine--tRNA ligase [Saprospiraceae bacterium]|nr:arginine--tRNA ligase [Saprospiraceae bacterium]